MVNNYASENVLFNEVVMGMEYCERVGYIYIYTHIKMTMIGFVYC